MTLRVHRKDYPSGEMVILGESEAIGIAEVQNALSGLWRKASEQQQQSESQAVSLACLWNLVAFHGNPHPRRGDSGGEAHRIQDLLQQVTLSLPARVIHLEQRRAAEAQEAGKEVEAWVNTCCVHTSGRARMVCCEEIHLAGYGKKGHSHFPALVRALLVPDLPTALLWLDDMQPEGRVLSELLELSDRIIIDNQQSTDPASLSAVKGLLDANPGKVVDLGWLRLTPLRHLLADFFDPPGRAEQLARMEHIVIDGSAEGRNTGLLLLGWLLSRCGYREVRALEPGEGGDAYRWQAADGKKALSVDFQVREGYGGMDGIFRIEIQAAGDTFSLTDVDPEHMAMKGPDHDRPSVALREADEPELVVRALGGKGTDPVYGEALAMGAELVAAMRVKSEQRNP